MISGFSAGRRPSFQNAQQSDTLFTLLTAQSPAVWAQATLSLCAKRAAAKHLGEQNQQPLCWKRPILNYHDHDQECALQREPYPDVARQILAEFQLL